MTETVFPTKPTQFVQYEMDPNYTREEITLLQGAGSPKGGTILGQILVDGAGITEAAVAGNIGDGAMGTATAGAGIQAGIYTVLITEPIANAGAFIVYGPDGAYVGKGNVAAAFTGPINFTLADGATDFAAGDAFEITVPVGSLKYEPVDLAGVDGTERVAGVLLLDQVVPAAADLQATVVTQGPAVLRDGGLIYPAGATDPQKAALKAQLEALRFRVV